VGWPHCQLNKRLCPRAETTQGAWRRVAIGNFGEWFDAHREQIRTLFCGRLVQAGQRAGGSKRVVPRSPVGPTKATNAQRGARAGEHSRSGSDSSGRRPNETLSKIQPRGAGAPQDRQGSKQGCDEDSASRYLNRSLWNSLSTTRRSPVKKRPGCLYHAQSRPNEDQNSRWRTG